jgi:hypothetical protein
MLAERARPDDLANLILMILSDNKLKTKLEKRALELGRQWTWPAVGAQYTHLFKQILNDQYVREEELLSYARL